MSDVKTQLVFLDLETTGLDENLDEILEIGMILVDDQLEEINTFQCVVKPCDINLAIERMDEYVEDMHTTNGLLDELHAGSPVSVVADLAINYLDGWFAPLTRFVMAGNSIHFDRKFLRNWMPDFESVFYHRMLDVSAFQTIADLSGIPVPEKGKAHRALDDCRMSIRLAKHWQKLLQMGSFFSRYESDSVSGD